MSDNPATVPPRPEDQCAKCGLPVEAAIHWPGMVPDAHPFEEPPDD